MRNGTWGGIDVISPKEPVVITLEIEPEEIELAFATGCDALREKLLKALIVAMISDTISM